ncbi:universal stress protein [Terricaulis sp.]|uniref:universal stress protein n=1 Tax=Terricaulis sp. TaxID=2768686 RepID=UPI0037841A71
MTWKDILVFADGSEDGLVRVKLALALAQAHEAHLEAQVVSVLPLHPWGPFSGAVEQAYQGARSAALAQGQRALAAIRGVAAFGADFSGQTCEAGFDAVQRVVAAAARPADLVMLGKPETHDRSDLDTEIFMGAVFSGGQPCLMLPRWVQPQSYGKRALIAWKATPQAARALHAALPLLKRAESVRIAVVDAREEEPGEQRSALERLTAQLSRHGVRVEEPVMTQSMLGEVSQAIDAQVLEFGADLLVMGAYGHSRMGEFVFGGVSRSMIRGARVPVLLSH